MRTSFRICQAAAAGVLVSCMLYGAGASANAPAAQAAQTAPRYGTYQKGGYTFVDRSTLPNPSKPKLRIAVLHEAMTDEVYGRGLFAQQGHNTPALDIVGLNARLHQVREADAGSQTGKFVVKASDLKDGKLKAMLLMPQNGHIGGASEYWKEHNIFHLVLNGTPLPQVKSLDFVTLHEQELTLKPGTNILHFWPQGSGQVPAYHAGREMEIEVQ